MERPDCVPALAGAQRIPRSDAARIPGATMHGRLAG